MVTSSQMRAAFAVSGNLVTQFTNKPTIALANQVLIRTAAAGINRPDVLQRQGIYPPPPGHSEIPGLEVSGIVDQVGSEVTRFKVGDKVCALTNGGGYAEYAVVQEGQVLSIPLGLSLLEAACIPETYFTVYHVLKQQRNIFGQSAFEQDNCSVLIHGGSSGIGLTAIQLSREWGAKVLSTAGSEEKCTSIGSYGGIAINYNREDFAEKVMQYTNGEGVDLVLDMVGGPYTSGNMQILKTEGRLAVIGSLGSPIAEQVDLRMLMRKRLTVGGSTIRAQSDNFKTKIASELEEEVWPLFQKGKLRVPIFSASFTLDSLNDAHTLMESSKHIGKICAVINPMLLD